MYRIRVPFGDVQFLDHIMVRVDQLQTGRNATNEFNIQIRILLRHVATYESLYLRKIGNVALAILEPGKGKFLR